MVGCGCRAQNDSISAGRRLTNESSPYLRQHADNLVDWYPWGDEAFQKARKEDKPVFLSIGYSTCHWCHVMEEESFMDPAVADYLNQNFVSIKVDRETRPDVDEIYMNFVQRTTGRGGWPMTVFLTADRMPFFGGTYYPNPPKYNKIGFLDLLKKVDETWRQDREELLRRAGQVAQELEAEFEPRSGVPPKAVLQTAVQSLDRRYDSERGGFLPAPKFPSPPVLEFLLRQAALNRDDRCKEMVLKTLRGMALGGIRDHLEGGFHRYSTDAKWLVPHFEKMLYDQGQLLSLYSQAYAWSKDELFREAALSIMSYLDDSMRTPEGAYFSAEDADSALSANPEKHAEGAYYVWSYQELKKALSPQQLELCTELFGVSPEGNATGDPAGELAGLNVLARSTEQLSEAGQALVVKLQTLRKNRPRPARDEKILTEWNALVAAGLADAGRYLELPERVSQSRQVLKFIEDKLVVDGRLKRSYFEERAEIDAFAIDYLTLVHAYLALYQAEGNPSDLTRAMFWQKQAEQRFGDSAGGYFDTAEDTELPVRRKSFHDGAKMSANSRAALNLSVLYELTGRADYQKTEEALLKTLAPRVEENPTASAGALSALLTWYSEHEAIIVVSAEESWWNAVSNPYRPGTVCLRIASAEQREELAADIPYLPEWTETSRAYRCRDFACGLPVDSLAAVKAWNTKDVPPKP